MRAIFSLLITVVYQPEFLPPIFTIIVYPRYVTHYKIRYSITNTEIQ